jgi:hypothetical protein
MADLPTDAPMAAVASTTVAPTALAFEETLWRTIEERLESLRASAVSASTRSSVGRIGETRPAVSSLLLSPVFISGSLRVDHKQHGPKSGRQSLSLKSMGDVGFGHACIGGASHCTSSTDQTTTLERRWTYVEQHEPEPAL